MRELARADDRGKTYSAHIEDYILRNLLPYAKGTYVDVGAYDPVQESNTYIFYERGWNGLAIEPQPAYATRFRATRPRDTVVECAVSDATQTETMRLWWGASSLSSDWPIPEKLPDGKPVGRLQVQVRRLDHILLDHPQFQGDCDLCSIDVEGYEFRALRSIDFSVFMPKVFVIESVEWGSLSRTYRRWEHLLAARGYVLVADNYVNRFYVRNDCTEILRRADSLA